MILMWLSSLVILFVGLLLFQSAVLTMGAVFRQKFLLLPESPVSTIKMLVVAKLCALSQGSVLRNQYSAMALINARVFSPRYSVLLLCLSFVGAWTTWLLALASTSIQWFVPIGISLILYLYYFWFNKGEALLRLSIGAGLFLLGFQLALRDQSMLFAVLGNGDLHFLLADGRFSAQALWLVVSFIVTISIGVEFWSLFVALALLMAGSLSVNGAVGFLAGEFLAYFWLLAWRNRHLNQHAKWLAQRFSIFGAIGVVISFVCCGILRDFFIWSGNPEAAVVERRTGEFMIVYLIFLVVVTMVLMAWGHFAARREVEDVQLGEYFSVRWIRRRWLSPEILVYILQKSKQRLAILIEQKTNLRDLDLKKIPPSVIENHEQEIVRLSAWLKEASDEGLENRGML